MSTKAEKEAAELKEREGLLAKVDEFNLANPDLAIQFAEDATNKEIASLLKKAEKGLEKEGGESKNEETSVDILREDNYIRTYSLDVHGEDFMKLAEAFVSGYPQREYKIVPSSEIEAVVLLYREKEDAEAPFKEQKAMSPIVEKSRKFSNKEEALKFNILVQGRSGHAGSLVVVRKSK